MFFHLIPLKLPQVAGKFHGIFQIFVYRKDCQCLRLFIHNAHSIQIRRIPMSALIHRHMYQCIQNRSPSVIADQRKRMVNGLHPCPGIRSHDRRNNVDQLRQACNLYTVRMAEHGDHHSGNQKRILKIINIFQLMRCLAPTLQLFILFVGVIPHVPLIKGQVDRFFLPFFCLYRIADGQDFTDKLIHIHRICQEFRRIVFLISVILMQGQIVYLIVTLGQNGILPGSKGRHCVRSASTCHQLNVRIHHLHDPSCFRRNPSILFRRFMSHLPWTVHLVAQTP